MGRRTCRIAQVAGPEPLMKPRFASQVNLDFDKILVNAAREKVDTCNRVLPSVTQVLHRLTRSNHGLCSSLCMASVQHCKFSVKNATKQSHFSLSAFRTDTHTATGDFA